MKKILMVAAILVVALAFLALPESQAGSGRPVRWKATFVDFPGANLPGSGIFTGGVDHVNINNGPVTTCTGASYLELQLFDPSLEFTGIGTGGFLDSGNPDLASYGFPGTQGAWPGCMANFLNLNVHPTEEYPHIILRFSTCGCDYPLNSNTDLMKMEVSDTLPVRMSFYFFAYNWLIRPTLPSTPFLNLLMKAHGWNSSGSGLPGDFDVKIVRTSATEWTAYVDTEFDNPIYKNELPDPNSYSFTESDNILGEYATYVPSTNKKGKTTWTATYHYPWAKAPLKFQIKFWQY